MVTNMCGLDVNTAEAPFGFDLILNIDKATNLISMDWNGSSDPYFILSVSTPMGQQLQYR